LEAQLEGADEDAPSATPIRDMLDRVMAGESIEEVSADA
jgi:hypothetical protein